MNFEMQQLVVFSIMLGIAVGITSVALGRVSYLAYRTPAGQGRTDWILIAVLLAAIWVFWAFQLWRIIIRF